MQPYSLYIFTHTPYSYKLLVNTYTYTTFPLCTYVLLFLGLMTPREYYSTERCNPTDNNLYRVGNCNSFITAVFVLVTIFL